MKSMNNLLLLGDGETWSRQRIDFAGLPEMARTFLQVAAGAADIPVTRLLGQSPAGLSATGESDVRNYYDMIAARQELDLRPQLERLDRLICPSEGIDEGALSFAFRPLSQLDEPAKAALALSRAQATQVYAGLGLWRAEVTAKLVEAQLVADGTYPNAAAVFAEQAEVVNDAREVGAVPRASGGFLPEGDEPRDWHGRWTTGAESGTGALVGSALRTASPAQGQQLAGPLPVPNTPADPSGAAGQGPHAPDGTPVELASSKNRARALTRMMGALAAAARFVWRWLPEAGDEPELLPAPDVSPQPPPPSPAPPQVQPSPLSLQDLTRVTRGFAGRKSAQKWLYQMNSREWTPEQIEEAIQSGERFHESQRIDPTHRATRYVHPRTGRSVTIDEACRIRHRPNAERVRAGMRAVATTVPRRPRPWRMAR